MLIKIGQVEIEVSMSMLYFKLLGIEAHIESTTLPFSMKTQKLPFDDGDGYVLMIFGKWRATVSQQRRMDEVAVTA